MSFELFDLRAFRLSVEKTYCFRFFIIIIDRIYVKDFLKRKRILKQLYISLRAILNDTRLLGFELLVLVLSVFTRKKTKKKSMKRNILLTFLVRAFKISE